MLFINLTSKYRFRIRNKHNIHFVEKWAILSQIDNTK